MQENHRRHGFDPCIRNIPWSRAWQPIPIFLPGEFHGQRSLVGSSPQGHKESDTTKASKHSTSTTPLAVQWLRLCFHCSRHGFDPWVGNEPTSRSTVQPRKKKRKKEIEPLTCHPQYLGLVSLVRSTLKCQVSHSFSRTSQQEGSWLWKKPLAC